jgi:hypothetical protein
LFNHRRFIASFLFAVQVPIGVVSGIEIAATKWVDVAVLVVILTLLETAAWEIMETVNQK